MNYIDIFYNNIIKEAANGRVNCLFIYNVLFSTKITEDNIHIKTQDINSDILTPTLIINNKDKFNKLLIEYVECAKEFYNLEKMENELNSENHSNDISIEKIIMTLLWSNATVEDFMNPVSYLQKRIEFIRDTLLLKYEDEYDIGYSKILDSNIHISVKKDSIYNETPYMIEVKLVDNNSNESFNLPDIKLGISNNKAYIYSIQNKKEYINNNGLYRKKINRLLFKIGENFKDDTLYDDESLKDITSSFVVSANIVLGILDYLKIDEVIISPLLITRWNSRFIMDNVKHENNVDKYVLIQKNLTDKFLRTFRRIMHHNKRIKVDSYPFEIDSNMHLVFDRTLNNINNPLLDETYNLLEFKNEKHI